MRSSITTPTITFCLGTRPRKVSMSENRSPVLTARAKLACWPYPTTLTSPMAIVRSAGMYFEAGELTRLKALTWNALLWQGQVLLPWRCEQLVKGWSWKSSKIVFEVLPSRRHHFIRLECHVQKGSHWSHSLGEAVERLPKCWPAGSRGWACQWWNSSSSRKHQVYETCALD